MRSLIVLEFNEINPDLFDRMLSAGQLPNFSRFLKKTTRLKTTVQENYRNLEPWIQWVTAHTGKSQKDHKAFNLSDVQHSNLVQIWDVLEQKNVACGVVSPMNARRGELNKGFFIPDPWSISSDTYPENLAPIYNFLRERVQSHNITLEQGASKLGFAFACLKVGVPASALFRVGASYIASRVRPRRKWRLAAELDRFLFEVTVTLHKKKKTAYNSVFFNAVAHYQHHYWTEHDASYWRNRYPKLFARRNRVAERNLEPGDDPIAYGMKVYDAILGRAISVFGEQSVMIATALSQVPFEGYRGDTGFYLYRPYDHARLFRALGIAFTQCSPLMSRDAMLYFADDAQRSAALAVLNETKVAGFKLFLCTEEAESRLFCKIDYTFDVTDGASIEAPGVASGSLRFGDHLQLITFKTGHHFPDGFVIASNKAFDPKEIAEGIMPLEAMPSSVFRLMSLENETALMTSLLQDRPLPGRYDVGFAKPKTV